MNFFNLLGKINRLNQLILNERTGNPKLLSNRLGISRSTLYRILDELKSYDAPIEYSRERETFYYSKYYELDIHCSIKLIDDEQELRKVIGGHYLFSSVSILRRKKSILANQV